MKNKFLYILLALLGTGFWSCEEELEIFPTDAIAIELAFNNEVDFDNAIKGIYSGFRRDGYYGPGSANASIYFIPDVISDNVIINTNGRRSREQFYDWRYDEDGSSQTFWLSAYKVIQRANLILENIDVLDDGEFKNNVRGQALAARGIAHFDLAKFYADSPAQSSDGFGVPYVTSTDSGLTPGRNTLSETYTNILNDLNTAFGEINDDNGVGRINKSVVAALLSRIYLFMGDFDNVIVNTDRVVGEDVSLEQFANVWNDETDAGVLWKIRITEPDDAEIGVAWLQESPDGIRSEYNVDFSLFSMYEDNDVRKAAYFETSDFSGVPYNHIIKYRGRLTGNANLVDAKVIRYAEVLLNKAEAHAMKNQDGMALTALNTLRANRYDGFSSPDETGQSLKDAIAKERRLELAFEGDRFFELKRKGLPIIRSTFGDQADGTGIPAEFLELPAGDYRFNMAIGNGETAANPNIQQNNGY